jgi:hypothetical protein
VGRRGGIAAGARESTDWCWIYGCVATALGCLPSAIDDEPVVNIFRLLKYWQEEPPAHVMLALRYLGARKKPGRDSGNPAVTEKQAQAQMHETAAMMGGVGSAPEGFAEMVEWAAAMEAKVKAKSS